MKTRTFNTTLAYALTLIIGSVSSAHAAPGTIAQQPLFLQSSVPPNIFFLNDNSDSMEWELMTKDYSVGGRLKVDSDNLTPTLIHKPGCDSDTNNNGYLDQTDNNGNVIDTSTPRIYYYILQTSSIDNCETVAEEEWRARFYEYNATYYNPSRTYKPWAGKSANGSDLFDDASITAAKIDPNDANSATIDLTQDSAVLVPGEDGADPSRSYYSSDAWSSWCTSKGISSGCEGWRYYEKDADGNLTITWVHELTDEIKTRSTNATPQSDKTNFANWFTYHRSREYSAKYATSVAIQKATQARIGYGTINDSSANSIRIDNQSTEHKAAVLNKLFNTNSIGSTPLKRKLKAVGEYYEDGTFFGDDGNTPILSEADGGACQSNNVIMMTDGFYNDGSGTYAVGNIDGDNGAPYADNITNTLADMAMYFYERDLAPTITNLTRDKAINEIDYTPDVDDTALHQHMNTHTLAFGLKGSIDPDTVDINAGDFTWPLPYENTAARIDDLFHAAVNGRGKYLSAANPDELVNALVSTVRDINDKTQSATSVAMSAFRLDENALIFFSSFSSESWTGELVAHGITDNGLINTTETWNAADNLDNNDSRNIFTYSNFAGAVFQWDDISVAMQNELIAGDTETGIGAARLDYLRGVTANNFGFRQRDSILGDIINSSPVYVGAPASPYPDRDPFGSSNKRYFDFWNSNKGRTKMLYVGANDGMLHGFNANSGEEVFAYVPATVFPNLHELTDPDYTHRYYVDKTPTVGDAFFDDAWHTILVGALGAGGQGLFALDVTDPTNFTESDTNADNLVLWEFDSSDDADLGYTFSQPVIGMTEEGRWAVFVGNGYNSESGIATLFIIYLDADSSDGWDLNTDYRKISTQVGGHADADKNGLSSPTAVDSNGNGKVDRVYAGDLEGNMWVFDLSSSTPSDWDVAYQDSSSEPRPLFKATDANNVAQPITVKPSIIRHPDQATIHSDTSAVNTSPNLLVLFGTGQYLTTGDLDNTQMQSFYAVWDKGQAFDQNNIELSRSNLIAQTITSGTAIGQNIEARITSNNDVPYGSADNTQRFGWYIDLDTADATTGERVVSNAVVINDVVFFTTYIPNNAACGTGGSSWFMFLNAVNGSYPDRPVVSINNDRLVNEDDVVSLNQGDDETAPSGLLIEGSLSSPSMDIGTLTGNGTTLINTSEGIDNIATNGNVSSGDPRMSWRELRPD